jgi:hypothetical protein
MKFALAQDTESPRARIEEHYTAMHTSDNDAVRSHHLDEITIFPGTGHVLMEPGWEEASTRMGTEIPFPDAHVTMTHFSAQIYDDVGVALLYLDGSYGVESGTWRVSAVWVWRGGRWMEAHHHELPLVN